MSLIANHFILSEIAKSIRSLSIDAIEAAGCGHPGLPLGCADIVAVLYANILRQDPNNPDWVNRDRFVLSAGHGSMVLYSALHLAGFDLSLQDIKDFRKLHSKTPGHPEFRETPGVETTTGPLGQGVAMAVGMALGLKMNEARYEMTSQGLLDARVYVLAGDGDLMEGVSAEACSFAGHLALNNLVIIYDSNDICLDGPIDECFTEDVQKRYESYGFRVDVIDGHSFDDIENALKRSKSSEKPTLIIAKTVIGKGAPTVQGTSDVHGKVLGSSEAEATKAFHQIPSASPFWVSDDAYSFFAQKKNEQQLAHRQWEIAFANWSKKNPELATQWESSIAHFVPNHLLEKLDALQIKANFPTRQSSNAVQQLIAEELPQVVVGSADLSCSDNTLLKVGGVVKPFQYHGRNIKYGVREFAMGAISVGLSLQGMTIPVCGTFFTFSDYMKNAIRLSALMKVKVIYHFTHDSVFLGEDGPTHQPVEHLAALRAMPGLTVIRPADAHEVRGAWATALTVDGPVALILTRLAAPDLSVTSSAAVSKGGYVVVKESRNHIDYVLIATGSEVDLAVKAAADLDAKGYSVRVVSLPSFELFDAQPEAYRRDILVYDQPVKKYVSIEAQSSYGWHKYVGRDGLCISIDHFGASAPADVLRKEYGFTPEAVVDRIIKGA